MNILYPVSRSEGDGRSSRSGLIGARLPEPSPINVLFQRVLRGIVQDIAAVVASAFIIIPVATVPPAAEAAPKILAGAIQTIEERAPFSFLIGQRLPAPNPIDILFQRPLLGIEQPVAEYLASKVLTPPPATPPSPLDVLFQRPLVGVFQEIAEYRASFAFGTPAPSPTESQKLLFGRPVQGIVQEVVEYRPSITFGTVFPSPTAEQKLFFQRALAGFIQPVADYPPSVAYRLTGEPPTIDILFSRPLGSGLQDIIEVPASQLIRIPVALPTDLQKLLFQKTLVGVFQPGPEVRFSILIGGRLPEPSPVNTLFQRPLFALEKPRIEVLPSRILPIPFPDAIPQFPQLLFLRPLKRALDEQVPEYVSTILYGIEPERDVLFLHPLTGKVQDLGILVAPPKLYGVQLPVVTPINILFGNPIVGKFHPILDVPLSRILTVTFPDVPPPPPDILFQRPLSGRIPDEIVVGLSALVSVPAPNPTDEQKLLLFKLAGVIHPELVILPSDFIRVRPADTLALPIDLLFQRVLAGIIQDEITAQRPTLIRVPFEEATLKRLTALSFTLDPILSQTISWTGNVIPVSITAIAPVGAPPGGKGVVIQIEGTIVRLYAWDGTTWRVLA